MGNNIVLSETQIKNKIHTIRGLQVMLDRDLAELYEVESIRLREQVKRNIERFPEDFMFQLTESEFDYLRSQIVILENTSILRSQIATTSRISSFLQLTHMLSQSKGLLCFLEF